MLSRFALNKYSIVILAFFLNLLQSEAQWNFTNNPYSQFLLSNLADTSDYISYSEPNALELNLMIAASKGNTIEIERLLVKGADINFATNEGATALVFAVIANKTEAVRTLLKYKPDLEYVTKNNETPLMIAVKLRYFDISELLIREGANTGFADRFGATPLHYASIYGYIDIADLLLYYDANTDVVTYDGTTPLLAAVWVGKASTSDLLVQAGAGLEIADNSGYTPLLQAAYNGDTLIMDLLLTYGANLYATTNKGHNALTISIISDDIQATKYLLKKGSLWNVAKSTSLDPYLVASKYHRKDAAELLKESGIDGDIKFAIDQMEMKISSKFNLRDYYTGFSFAFKEPFLNLGFVTGIDMKLWDTRVMIEESNVSFYQYHHRNYLGYAGIFKDLGLSEGQKGWNTMISASLSAGYSFGNTLKGTMEVPADRFVLIPSAALKVSKLNLTFSAGAEYLKTPFYKNGPLWVRIGIGYNYFFDNIRIKSRIIRWY